MTRLVKFFVNSSPVKIQSAKVKRNGDRTVDTCEFKIPPAYPADQGDTVSYLQDVVDLTHLKAIWNFQQSARDEGGYDIDGDDGTYTADYIQDSTRSFTENTKSAIRFNADNEVVTVADNTRIDFSKQFDIICVVRAETFPTGAMTFFSKSNGGVGGGIELGVTSGDPGYIEVELFATAGTLTTITGSTVNLRDNAYHFVRVKRDDAGLVSVIVDGTLEGSATEADVGDDYTATGVSLLFGKNFGAGSKHFRGAIAQIRIYCGGYLSDSEYTTLRFTKRQPMTMKFRGKVQNVENSVGYKTLYAQSINELIINTRISKTVMDARDKDSTNNGIDNIFLDDTGGTRMRTDTIIEDILTELDSNYIFATTEAAGEIMTRYIARGLFSTMISQLFALDNRSFWITPRQVFIKGNNSESSKISIHQGEYDVNVSGKDNTLLINDVEAVGEIQIHNKTQLFSGTGSQTAFNLTNTPIRTKVSISSVAKVRGLDSSDSAGNDYYIEYTQGATSGAQIIFYSAPASGTDNISVEYDYEATGTLYFRNADAASITANGRHSGRFYAAGFAPNQLASLVSSILTDRKTVPQRIRVVSASLMNFVREGMEFNIKYPAATIDGTFILKSIEWIYPEGITVLEFGTHNYDYFDIMKGQNERAGGVDDTLVKTNNI